jgi:hypothetical protein
MKGLSVNQYHIAVLNTTPKLLKRGTMGKMAPRNIFIDTKCLKNANFRSYDYPKPTGILSAQIRDSIRQKGRTESERQQIAPSG